MFTEVVISWLNPPQQPRNKSRNINFRYIIIENNETNTRRLAKLYEYWLYLYIAQKFFIGTDIAKEVSIFAQMLEKALGNFSTCPFEKKTFLLHLPAELVHMWRKRWQVGRTSFPRCLRGRPLAGPPGTTGCPWSPQSGHSSGTCSQGKWSSIHWKKIWKIIRNCFEVGMI